tara:strand:- start:2749 stop:3042 length:294 start_codon:yes stop_codon:yes gene_type:complete
VNLRAPYVKRGQALTLELWNQQARAINQGLAAPRDSDGGVFADEVADASLREQSRTTDTVRVYNPDDEEQYVDVQRITSLTTRNTSTGQTVTTFFSS